MNKDIIQKKIAEFYTKLPPKAQNFFSEMSWLETLRQISQKFSLTVEQMSVLGTETTLLLLGIVNKEEFEKTLANDLKTSPITINRISEDVSSLIIKDMQEILDSAFYSNTKDIAQNTNISLVENINSIITGQY